jgi:hypothetical protein
LQVIYFAGGWTTWPAQVGTMVTAEVTDDPPVRVGVGVVLGVPRYKVFEDVVYGMEEEQFFCIESNCAIRYFVQFPGTRKGESSRCLNNFMKHSLQYRDLLYIPVMDWIE